ncbi:MULTISPECIES: hypothetical protein [unclassified Bradyrhizobium]|uniref:hypothetical protein n=1 Tax=unclassified Bradyrhizobium TaxID=2631580 RepID=UPI003390BAD8
MVIDMDPEARKAFIADARARNYEQRSAADDEPEFTLTEREFDSRLRRAFAERERNVEKQVRGLLAEHMREIESRIAALPRAPTLDEIERMIRSTIVEYHPATMENLSTMADEIFKRIGTEARAIAKLRDEHDLRISALLQATEKLERGLSGDRAGEVIEVPAFIGRRHA